MNKIRPRKMMGMREPVFKRSAARRAAATSATPAVRCIRALMILSFPLVFALNASAASGEPDTTSTSPRQLYNDGTKHLAEHKFEEAEACLQGAVASQNSRVQGPALYNLGE